MQNIKLKFSLANILIWQKAADNKWVAAIHPSDVVKYSLLALTPLVPGESRLDKYLEWVNDQDDGVLEEEQIEQLCAELGEPELLHHLIELRARHLRMNTTTKFASEYTLISDRRE